MLWQWGRGHISHQHHPTLLANGHVLLLDNGAHRRGLSYSRVIAVDPSTNAIAWEYHGDPLMAFFTHFTGGAERLPNGNTLICEGNTGRLFEVTPTCEVVWEYLSPFFAHGPQGVTNGVFRYHRYGPDHPALRGRDLDPSRHRNFNRLYGGRHEPSAGPVKKRERRLAKRPRVRREVTMAHMTGGQAIVKQLKAEGVDTIFGIIGNSTFSLYDALYAEPSIRHYTARNELGAASMADGYARVTGRPGVCFSTVGPGAAHTLSALGEAYTESSPVLHLTSQIEADLVGKHRGVYHESPDQLALFRPLTMWTHRVRAVADIPWAIHEAFRLFKTRRPQPVHLEVPSDIIAGTGNADILPAEAYEPARAETADVRRAVERLLQAERPIIYAGGGVTRAGASAELITLAELLQAPVVNTCVGKGTIPGDHPLALGHLMMTPPVRALIERADVMLAIGTRFTPRATAGWSLTMPHQLIQIDLDPTQFGKNYAAELCLLGDAKAVLQQVLEEVLRAGPPERPARTAEVEAARTAGYNGLKEQFPRELRILEEIRELLPRNGVLCAQSIIGHWSRVAFPVYEPGTYLYANSFGSMGWTFQAGFGAKFALPERQVMTICGDGGMMVNCGELASAVENGVKMPVVVFNNGGYYIIKHLVKLCRSGQR